MPLHVSSTSAHRQDVKIVLYNLWYHHTETSDWYKITKITKITKIQFCKYKHIVDKHNLIDTTTNQQFIRYYD